MLAENMHFFIAYFLGENSRFGNETSHTVKDNSGGNSVRELGGGGSELRESPRNLF